MLPRCYMYGITFMTGPFFGGKFWVFQAANGTFEFGDKFGGFTCRGLIRDKLQTFCNKCSSGRLSATNAAMISEKDTTGAPAVLVLGPQDWIFELLQSG